MLMIINILNGALLRYLHPADHHSAKIAKTERDFDNLILKTKTFQ